MARETAWSPPWGVLRLNEQEVLFGKAKCRIHLTNYTRLLSVRWVTSSRAVLSWTIRGLPTRREESLSVLFLGGAAVHRCDKRLHQWVRFGGLNERSSD